MKTLNKLKIPGTPNLYIDEEFTITDTDNEVLKEYKNYYVNICLFGKYVNVTKEYLYWFSKYKLSLPADRSRHIDKFVFTPIKETKRVHDQMFVEFPTHVTVTYNGMLHRMVPRFPSLAVNFNGTSVIRIDKAHEMPVRIYESSASSKYPYIWVRNKKNQFIQNVHRLVAMAWVHNDDPTNKVFVDHLNGNKDDPRASNLEWVTIRDNNKRAVDTGLKDDNIPLKIRNCETGLVEYYASSTDVIDRIGRSRINLQTVSLTDKCFWKGSNGLFEIKKSKDSNGWLSEDMELNIENTSTLRRVVLDNKMYFIETRADLASLIPDEQDRTKYSRDGYSYEDVLRIVKKYHPTIISDPDKKSLASKDKRVYIGMNINTSEIIRNTSSVALAKLTGNVKSSVNKSIQHNGAYDFNGWVFKVDNDQPFSPIIARANHAVKIRLINAYDSNDVTIVDSYRAAGLIVGCDKKIIRNRANLGVPYNNYYIETLS